MPRKKKPEAESAAIPEAFTLDALRGTDLSSLPEAEIVKLVALGKPETLRQVRQRWGEFVPERALYNAVRSGELPAWRVGRGYLIPPHLTDAWVMRRVRDEAAA